jgi:3-hydroxybutyryl-CoA dehydratase
MKKGDKFQRDFFVSDELVKGFIDLFNDRHPLHTDKIYAQEKGYHEEIVHGNILNGFLSYFIGQCLPIKNIIIQSQNIEYCSPIYVGAKLEFIAEIKDIFDSVRTIELVFSFKNQEGIKVAKGKVLIGII